MSMLVPASHPTFPTFGLLLCLAISLCSPGESTLPTPQDSHGRLNTKHLSKVFKRFSAFMLPSQPPSSPYPRTPPPSTTERLDVQPTGESPVSHLKDGEYRRINEFELPSVTPLDGDAPPSPGTYSQGPVKHLYQEIKVSFGGGSRLGNVTLTKPVTSSSLHYATTSTSTTTESPPLTPTFASATPILATNRDLFAFDTSTEKFDEVTFATRPTDTCKCVCRNGAALETHDIQLDELKAKLLQAEILSETKTGYKTKVVDVLDGLMDDDESDYDDIDELEAIQKPTKYIPMEIIELSHRRPPNMKPHRQGVVDSSVISTSTPKPSTSSTRHPFYPTTASSTGSTALSAPLYSMSFTKPVSQFKLFATRVAQFGLPLLATVVLGNALAQIELVDRSAEDKEDVDSPLSQLAANLTMNPFNWNLFQMPLAGHGYYGPFFDALNPIVQAAHQQQQQQQQLQQAYFQPKSTVTKRKSSKSSTKENPLKRWLDKLI